jgi:hypothetical protein
MPLIQIFAPVSATTVTSILSPSHHHSICCQYFQNMTTLPLAHGEHRSFPLSSSSSLLAYALRTVRCWPTSLLCMLRTTWPRSPPSRRSYSQRSRRWHARGGGGQSIGTPPCGQHLDIMVRHLPTHWCGCTGCYISF